MKKFLTFATFLIVILSSTSKVHSIEADVFIQSVVNRAAKTLSGNFTKEERVKELEGIAKDTVDIEGLGFYSLGAFRKNLNEDQVDVYKEVFSKYFLKSFSSRLAEYSNPEIVVESKRVINEFYTIVSSKLIATESRPAVIIEWRVYTKNPNNLLIRDLIIEGLSLARTQKEEFSSIINSNDGKIEALLENLSNFSNK